MIRIRSERWWLGVFMAWAVAWTARGDVLVMRDGRLLLGDIRNVNGDQVVVALGAAGSTTVSGAAILTSIRCPDAERPDTFLKAARRAWGQGLLQPAAACYEKSLQAEPSTAATARTELAALRREMTVRAAGRVTTRANDQRAEAQRLIAEGELELRGATMAQQYDTGHRGPAAKGITEMGRSMAKAAEEKIRRGHRMLADLDSPPARKADQPVAMPAPAPPVEGRPRDWLDQNWPWVVGCLLALILLLRFTRRAFFG